MSHLSFFRFFLAAVLAVSLFSTDAPLSARADNQIQSTFTVNNTGDAGDLVPGDGECTTTSPGSICTLRAAIQEVNAYASGAPHTITFSDSYSSYLIRPSSNLPALTRSGTILDGNGHNVTIQYNGGSNRALEIQASDVLIRGLTIDGFYNGIVITSGSNNVIGVVNNSGQRNVIINSVNNGIEVNSGSGNRISGNYLGLDTSSHQFGNQNGVGVYSAGTIVGTNDDGNYDAMEGNIISGNSQYGIVVGAGGDSAAISGNIIGLKADGLTALPNGMNGILVSGASNVLIGTDGDNLSDAQQRNVISGNADAGIHLFNSHGDRIAGNYIGLSSNGLSAIPNTEYGVWVRENSYSITIGVDETNTAYSASERNVISGNSMAGIYLQGYQTTVAGNYIGTDKNGSNALGNVSGGLSISGHDNTIGTDGDNAADSYEGNVVSGNTTNGLHIYMGVGNHVAGNIIGLNAAGSAALGNSQHGISVSNSAASVRIGTDGNGVSDTYERNIVSGNGSDGILFNNPGSGAVISGNYIGTDMPGTSDLGNGGSGIRVESATQTVTIGLPNGGVSAQVNVISGNAASGIHIYDSDGAAPGTGAIIAGNYIGVDLNAGYAIPNDEHGVYLWLSDNARIGTDGNGVSDTLEKNYISGNSQYGIAVVSSNNAAIAGNWIGVNYTGDNAISNGYFGIAVTSDSSNTRIGTNGDKVWDEVEGNVISGNTQAGIYLYDQTGTAVAGNIIGLSASHSGGSTAVPNGKGIWISGGSKDAEKAVGAVRIGTNADGFSDSYERNLISGNSGPGIYIAAGSGHSIAGNYIGLDYDGIAAIPNGGSGVWIAAGAGSGTHIGTNGDGNRDGNERNLISGNIGYGVRLESDGEIVAGNYIGTDASSTLARPNSLGGVWINFASGNIIGMNSDGSTGEASERNLISGNGGPGVRISSGGGNRVAGNRIGTSHAGTSALPNQAAGIKLDASSTGNTLGSNHDGSNDTAEGNLISGNNGSGVEILGPTSGTTILYGNIIGLAADQVAPLPNTGDGIYVSYGNGIEIGEAATDQINWIGANLGSGIYLGGTTTNIRITNNRIGVTLGGTAAGNNVHGVHIYTQDVKEKGLTSAGPAIPGGCLASKACVLNNQIANNNEDGVFVGYLASGGYQIMGNSFYNNGGLGIDLNPSGVNGNDPGDGDVGANNGQNYPIVESVSFPSPGNLRVTGSFNSTPSSNFTIQLYASMDSDPTGYGEGLDPIYSFSLSTHADGNATFDVTFACLLNGPRSYFTALAFASDWSTSEFGPNLHLPFEYIYLPMISR